MSSKRESVAHVEEWRRCSDDIRQAVVRCAPKDAECSARLLYRGSRKLMRSLGVRTPAELYGVLQVVYCEAIDEVRFGDHLSVGFGKFDSARQVRGFVERHSGEPKSVIANAYEREYGFSAGVAEIWIDLFSDVEEVTLADWLSSGQEKTASGESEDERSTVLDFLERELFGDICDASLVRKRFSCEFPAKPNIVDDAAALSGAGYYEDRSLLFKKGATPAEHLARLIKGHPSFTKGDPGFEEAVWKHPAFRGALQAALASYELLTYEADSYISFLRLHDVMAVRMTDIESYAPTVAAAVPQFIPFTAFSLRNLRVAGNPLDSLDMPDAFYEGLLNASGLFRSCIVAGTRVFCSGGEGRLSATSLVEWLVARNEGIGRDDFPKLLFDELGIRCPQNILNTIMHNADVYYDDIGDAYYSSMEQWKKEARNELA